MKQMLLVPASAVLLISVPARGDPDYLRIDKPPCILPANGFNPDIARPTIAKRNNLLRRGKTLGVLLEWLYAKGVERNAELQLELQLGQASEALAWTGETGALIEVVLEVDKGEVQPPRFLYAANIGEGSCYYNVLLAHVSAPHLTQSPAEGYKVDNEASFYVWATVKDGALHSEVVLPGSRGPLLEKALSDSAAQAVAHVSESQRYHDRLLSIAASARLRALDEDAKAALDEAAMLVASNHARRGTVQSELAKAIEAEKRAAGANAWIGQLQSVLTIAQLVVQTKAMLAPVAPLETLEAMDKARSAPALAGVIGTFEKTSQGRKVTREGELALIELEQRRVTKILIDLSVRQGAPTRILPPIQ